MWMWMGGGSAKRFPLSVGQLQPGYKNCTLMRFPGAELYVVQTMRGRNNKSCFGGFFSAVLIKIFAFVKPTKQWQTPHKTLAPNILEMPTLAVDTCCFLSNRGAKVKCVICESVRWAGGWMPKQHNTAEFILSATHFPLQMLSPAKQKTTKQLNCRTNTGIRTEIGTMNSGFRGAFPLMRRQMKSVASYESEVSGQRTSTKR